MGLHTRRGPTDWETKAPCRLLKWISHAFPIVCALAVFILDQSGASADAPSQDGFRIAAKFEPNAAAPGAIVELQLSIEAPDGWVVFDLEQPEHAAMPTRIRLTESRELAPLGTFEAPPAVEKRDPQFGNRYSRYFERSPTFRRKVLIGLNAAGTSAIEGTISFLARRQDTGKSQLVMNRAFRAVVAIRSDAADRDRPATAGPIGRNAPGIPASAATSDGLPRTPEPLPKANDAVLPTAPHFEPAKPLTSVPGLPPRLSEPPSSAAADSQPPQSQQTLAAPAVAAANPATPASISRPVVAPPQLPPQSESPASTKSADPPAAPTHRIDGQWLYDDPALAQASLAAAESHKVAALKPHNLTQRDFSSRFDSFEFRASARPPADTWLAFLVDVAFDGGWTVIPALIFGLLLGWQCGRCSSSSTARLATSGLMSLTAILCLGADRLPRSSCLSILVLLNLWQGFLFLLSPPADWVCDEDPLREANDFSQQRRSYRKGMLAAAVWRMGIASAVAAATLTALVNQPYAAASAWSVQSAGIFVGSLLAVRPAKPRDQNSKRESTAVIADPIIPLPSLLLGLAFLTAAIDLAAQWDLLDDRYDWLSYYHVVAGWGICAGAGLLRLLTPWGSATRTLFSGAGRLLFALLLGWCAFVCIAAMGEPPRTEGLFAHLMPNSPSSPSP